MRSADNAHAANNPLSRMSLAFIYLFAKSRKRQRLTDCASPRGFDQPHCIGHGWALLLLLLGVVQGSTEVILYHDTQCFQGARVSGLKLALGLVGTR
jgi:hypothetical protein|eukprot:COSAG01_NODE_1155_length_11480_cov_35.572445_2_plen_97_part_00